MMKLINYLLKRGVAGRSTYTPLDCSAWLALIFLQLGPNVNIPGSHLHPVPSEGECQAGGALGPCQDFPLHD